MDASLESELQALADGLDRGLFFDNLEPLIETSKRITDRSDGAIRLAAYVVESVLVDLQTSWDDSPVSPDSYATVNEELGPALKRVARAMIDPEQRVFLSGHEEELVGRLIKLQHDQTLL